MPVVDINNVSINYTRLGDTSKPTILLIHGLGQPAAAWPEYFLNALLERGFSILTMDNRDMGKSQKFDELGVPNILKMLIRQRLGMRNQAPYALDDMMSDTRGLLDYLQLGPVHVIGASMGGMIAQLLAIHAPEHVASLTSVMSHTGNPKLKRPRMRIVKQLVSRPKSWEFADRLEHSMKTWRMIGSPDYQGTDDELRAYVSSILENGAHPAGTSRQMAAIVAAGDRRAALQKLNIPSLIIHGAVDPLVPPQGGEETAAAIPGAQLEMIPRMGHDLPEALTAQIADLIQQHIVTKGTEESFSDQSDQKTAPPSPL